jgi:hypothetical protein
VVSSVAPRDIGKASGTFSTMRQLGGVFGVAVFAAAGSYASPRAFSDGFVAALVLPRRRPIADSPAVARPAAEPGPVGVT